LNRPKTTGICAFVAAMLFAASGRASTVDIHCTRLPGRVRAELQARARLLLLGAGMDTARVGVDCTPTDSFLVWVDGTQTTIDEASGLVEGALDAIENRIARAKQAERPKIAASRRESPTPAALELPDGEASSPFGSGTRGGAVEAERSSPKPSSDRELEGGVGFATAVELWSGSMLLGPRLDVGVGTGRGFAFVIGEGARFGFGSPDLGQVMVFDLQAGAAFGAPYQARSSFGVLLLVGAERLAVSAGRFAEGGVWTWSATASLGLRGSLELGDLDVWLGVDGLARSTTIQTGGATGVSIPAISGLVSLGGFLPAFSRAQSGVGASRGGSRSF